MRAAQADRTEHVAAAGVAAQAQALPRPEQIACLHAREALHLVVALVGEAEVDGRAVLLAGRHDGDGVSGLLRAQIDPGTLHQAGGVDPVEPVGEILQAQPLARVPTELADEDVGGQVVQALHLDPIEHRWWLPQRVIIGRPPAARTETLGDAPERLERGLAAGLDQLLHTGVVGEAVLADVRVDRHVGGARELLVVGHVQQIDDALGDAEQVRLHRRLHRCGHVDRQREGRAHLLGEAYRQVVDHPSIHEHRLTPGDRRVR